MSNKMMNLWPDELKIMVVDDEQDILNLIRLSLEPAGFRVVRTNRPEDGLALALREKPDLLVLDLMMPGLDGFELLRRIRRHAGLAKIPAIVVSARIDSNDQVDRLRLSLLSNETVDAYINKPFDPAVLLRTVKRVLLQHKTYLIEKKASRAKTTKASLESIQ